MAGWLAGFDLLRPYRADWLPDPDDRLAREVADAAVIVESDRLGVLATCGQAAKQAAAEVRALEERAATLGGRIKAAKARARTAAAEAKREARTAATLRKALDRAEARRRRDAELRAARELVAAEATP